MCDVLLTVVMKLRLNFPNQYMALSLVFHQTTPCVKDHPQSSSRASKGIVLLSSVTNPVFFATIPRGDSREPFSCCNVDQ